jgi:predicted membrane protein
MSCKIYLFSLLEIFLSQRISDEYHHFTHAAFILWIILLSIPPSFCNINLKYQNVHSWIEKRKLKINEVYKINDRSESQALRKRPQPIK